MLAALAGAPQPGWPFFTALPAAGGSEEVVREVLVGGAGRWGGAAEQVYLTSWPHTVKL